ncbi:MAG TPA: nuclease, partial [Blastocatellia bacterium]|nr:nuclease [Blastocatellia bacterium]
KYLKDHLTDLSVVRTGKVKIDIVVFGKTSEGSVAGFRTRAVET